MAKRRWQRWKGSYARRRGQCWGRKGRGCGGRGGGGDASKRDDCDDKSDEENCTVVKLRPDYRRGDPPRLEENVTNLIGEITDQSYQGWRLGLLHFIPAF